MLVKAINIERVAPYRQQFVLKLLRFRLDNEVQENKKFLSWLHVSDYFEKLLYLLSKISIYMDLHSYSTILVVTTNSSTSAYFTLYFLTCLRKPPLPNTPNSDVVKVYKK